MTTELLKCAASKQWEKIGIQKRHGINLPLFSLRSEQSSGIGEYLDLLQLLPWCKEMGFSVIQLLPLNDTGSETSPYSALSAFALHPLFISLHALPEVERLPNYQELLKEMGALNQSQRIDYAKVAELKSQFLRLYFNHLFPSLSASEEYKAFLKEHSWLNAYALFKTLKPHFNKVAWEQWPEEYKNINAEKFQKELELQHHEIDYHRFVQYLAFQQMERVKKEASSLGLFIKGDIPILLNRDSADVWYHRSLFLLNYSAGAPPDAYAAEGQNWGFPLYNWEELEKRKYEWWAERLQIAQKLYHIYRLDHIVGFFRLWSVPKDRKASEGLFVPSNPSEWIPHGAKILTHLLHFSDMLPIGEDLGTVPTEVRTQLRELGICGTKVLRWERRWEGDGGFIPLDHYIPESMTTVSTHDSETLQLWWRNSPEEAKLYAEFRGWLYESSLSLERRASILQDSHHTTSLFHINLLQEYLALFPDLVWPHPEDERINIPGKILAANWTYRFRPSLEFLINFNELKEKIKSIIN